MNIMFNHFQHKMALCYNLLYGGQVKHYPKFLTEEFSIALYNELKGTDVTLEKTTIYDKQNNPHSIENISLTSPFGVKWNQIVTDSYDKWVVWPRFTSSMSSEVITSDELWMKDGSKKWTPLMKIVKDHIESTFDVKIPYCQMNYYRNMSDHINFHGDNEMGDDDYVFSLSLGTTRNFCFRRKFDDLGKLITSGPFELTIPLENGSLCVFDSLAGKINYKHAIPKGLIRDGHSKECISNPNVSCDGGLPWCGCSRINITFRTANY